MLTLLRESIGTWVAKVFILLLVASFGVWGVSGAIVGGSSASVVEVGSTSVSANDYVLAYERARFGFSQQVGRLLTREEARAVGIDNNVMAQLVSGALLDESSRKLGLGLSDKSLASLIGEDAAFHDASGNFNRQVLQQQLRNLGMSEKDYIKNRQSVAIRNQLLEGVSANTQVPQAYIEAYDKYRNEKRVFEYVVLSDKLLGKAASPDEAQIKAYYDKNKTNYMAPEYRKIVIVKLEANDIANEEAITPEEIKDEYELRKSNYTVDEKRTIQQLKLEDEAQGKSILEKIKAGETFEAILEGLGKSDADINLGDYTKSGLPDTNVGNAAFGLKLNELSDVVTGIFGPVLLRVTQITAESVKPLKEVEADLRTRLALVKANDELFDIHDQLEDERAAGDNLSEAAKKVQLKPRILTMIDASGKLQDGTLVKDLPESAKLLRESFQTSEGVETDPISIGSSGFVWYEVLEVTSERQKDLSEVKDDVTKSWSANEKATAVEKLAIDLQKKLNDGDDFATSYAAIIAKSVGGEANASKLDKSAELSREDSSDDLSRTAVRAGFAIANEKTALAPGNKAGEQIVLKVIEIIGGAGNSVGPEEKDRLDASIGEDLLNQLIGDLRQREDVVISQSAIVAAQNLIR